MSSAFKGKSVLISPLSVKTPHRASLLLFCFFLLHCISPAYRQLVPAPDMECWTATHPWSLLLGRKTTKLSCIGVALGQIYRTRSNDGSHQAKYYI